jgi:hypothetical protein
VNVVTVNAAAVDPWATVTEVGTEATEPFELESVTVNPPAPAGADSVTVPDEVAPPVCTAGLTETLLKAAVPGLIFIPKPSLEPRYDAVKLTAVGPVTARGTALNVAELDPCGIGTVGGTVTSGSDVDKAIEAPPLGASADNWRVHVEGAG